jgi:hypothetical protein
MMQLKYLLIYLLVFLLTWNLYSQVTGQYELRTNQEIYSKLMDKNLEKLENQLVILGKDKIFCLVISGVEEIREFIYTKFRQRLYNYKIISEKDSVSADYLVSIEGIELKTKYIRIFGSVFKNRKVEREISISFVNKIKQNNSEDVLFKEEISDKNIDDFFLDNQESVERGDYAFLKGTLPERSFLDKAVIPGVVILASAITIVLFFVIRSK